MAKINLNRISHVYYTYKDLDTAHLFLLDFGLLEVERRAGRIFYRGYGTEHFVLCAQKGDIDVFGGAAFAVETFQDLERASGLPGATPIKDLDAPGGGQAVTLREPVNDFPFHFVYTESQGSWEPGKEHLGTQPLNYVIIFFNNNPLV